MIVLILTLSVFTLIESSITRRALLDNTATLAEVIGINSTAALAFNDKKSATETLAALSADSEVMMASIYTKTGKLFAQYQKSDSVPKNYPEEMRVPDPLPRNEGSSSLFLKSGRVKYDFHRNYLEMVNKIFLEREIIGYVYLRWSLGQLHQRLNWYICLAILALLPSSLIAYLLASRFQRIISRPIMDLAQTMKIVSQEKNFSGQVTKQGEDELGVLIDGFNEMLAEIKKREAALEQHREGLEQEVTRRTAELSRSNRELEKSEEKYRALMNNAGEGILLTDVEGNILEANQKMLELGDYSLEELLDLQFFQIIPPEEVERARAAFKGLQTLGFGAMGDFTLLRKDGKMIPLDITASLVSYAGKTVAQAILRDNTERKKMEEERLLLSKLESLGLLAGGIAHDFNNILTAILGNISLARLEAQPGGSLENDSQNRLEEAEKACLRAQALAGQLLSFAKGGQPIKKVISLAELVKESINLALSGSKTRCELILPGDLWPVEVDEGQVSQVFNNLMINADQAMPEGGTITVSAENVKVNTELPLPKGNYVKISISDRGVGIPQSYLSKIFDPYFTTKQKGSGLGLATSYSIIRKNAGYLTVESEVGTGTTFHVYLPAVQAGKLPPDKATLAIIKGNGRVLVMDDDEMVRDMLREMLHRLGYEAICAANGEEAIKLYKEALNAGQSFVSAIFDLTVPGGMGGKETIHRLLEIDPHIKAIVSSGYSDDPIMANYQEHGFHGVISKPYRIIELGKLLFELTKQD